MSELNGFKPPEPIEVPEIVKVIVMSEFMTLAALFASKAEFVQAQLCIKRINMIKDGKPVMCFNPVEFEEKFGILLRAMPDKL